jgi:hypothetical protein
MDLMHVAGAGRIRFSDKDAFGEYRGQTLTVSLSYEGERARVKDSATGKLLEGPAAEYAARLLQELAGV